MKEKGVCCLFNEFPFKAGTNSDYSLIFKLEMLSLLIVMS